MSTTIVFAIFCVIFCVLLIGVSMISKKWINDSSDFILAGREVSLLLNIMGVAAIGFAGTSIALNVGWTISFGIQGAMGFGIIYAVLGIMCYGNFFSKFIRRCGAQTLPEYLEMRYSPRVRKIVAWTTIIGLCGILANNIVSMAGVVSGYVGWPAWATITGVFVLMVAFAYLSGLWAITMTDFIQMIIGVIAVPLFAFLLIKKFGGAEFYTAVYPNGDFWTQGFKGAVLPVLSIKYPSYFTIAILFGAFLVWGKQLLLAAYFLLPKRASSKTVFSLGRSCACCYLLHSAYHHRTVCSRRVPGIVGSSWQGGEYRGVWSYGQAISSCFGLIFLNGGPGRFCFHRGHLHDGCNFHRDPRYLSAHHQSKRDLKADIEGQQNHSGNHCRLYAGSLLFSRRSDLSVCVC